MKNFIALIAAVAMLALAVPAQAAGFHDDPAIPNCSLFDKPAGCEWVATPVSASIAPIGFGHQSCGADAAWSNEDGYWHCVCV